MKTYSSREDAITAEIVEPIADAAGITEQDVRDRYDIDGIAAYVIGFMFEPRPHYYRRDTIGTLADIAADCTR